MIRTFSAHLQDETSMNTGFVTLLNPVSPTAFVSATSRD